MAALNKRAPAMQAFGCRTHKQPVERNMLATVISGLSYSRALSPRMCMRKLGLLKLDLAGYDMCSAPRVLCILTCCSCCVPIVDACMASARSPLRDNRGAALGQSDTTSFTRLGGKTCGQTTAAAHVFNVSLRGTADIMDDPSDWLQVHVGPLSRPSQLHADVNVVLGSDSMCKAKWVEQELLLRTSCSNGLFKRQR
jgi:hypothetical protein